MKDAKTLLLEFLAAVTHGENAASASDGPRADRGSPA